MVDGGGNMGFCEDLIIAVAVVSGVGWLSNSTPLTSGGGVGGRLDGRLGGRLDGRLDGRLGGVIDTGSLEIIILAGGRLWTGSEETLPGNSSRHFLFRN